MKKIHRTAGRIASAACVAILLIGVGILHYGCATMKVLPDPDIEHRQVTMIKQGVTTRQDVKILIGNPDEVNKYTYSRVNSTANKDERIAQVFDVFFDESGIVSKTYFLDAHRSAFVGEADPLLLYESISSFEIGKSTFSQSKEMKQPFIFMDIYWNGRLIEHVIGINSSSYLYGPIQKMPFIYTVINEDGTFRYNLGFTENGLLKSADELTNWTKEHLSLALEGKKSPKRPFQEIKNPPPDTALICLYSPNTYDLKSELSNLYVNREMIAKSFDKGEYTNYYAKPGEIVIHIDPLDLYSKDSTFRLIAEKGNVYYVRLKEWIVFDPMVVPEDEALRELSQCVHY